MAPSAPSVRVIATGGTIASQPAPGGVVASRGADELLASAGVEGVRCTTQQVLQLGSYRFAEQDVRTVAAAAVDAACQGDVDGVVVTHGTDTMEESAFLADLVHAGDRPIVFCGAQRHASEPDGDGARNLRDAVRLAAHPEARGLGVAICMAGHAWPARHATKVHSLDVDAFAAGDAGAVAAVDDERVAVLAVPRRPDPLPRTLLDRPLPSVQIIPAYAGVDGTLLQAALDAGARGLVVAAFGIGNVTDALADAAGEAIAAGVPVVVTSRCAAGPVRPVYGGPGGGAQLAERGAIFAGRLRPPHARLLLAAALSIADRPSEVGGVVAPFT
jgi:L-asparaginase